MIHKSTALLLFLLAISTSLSAHAQLAHQTERVPLSPAIAKRMTFQYMDIVALDLLPRVREALKRIPSPSRRLLAVKYYLHRDSAEIARKWAWTSSEAKEFRGSEEYRRAMEEIAKVRAKFAELNPGHGLQVHMEIRSLGSQIGKWNKVRSIGIAADELIDTCMTFFTDTALIFPGIPDEESIARFREFIRTFEPKQLPTVACPGLSQHGQLRAFDFRVMRGGRLVAGTSTRSIPTAWDEAGWTAKLKEAIEQASDRFEGPLEEPYEPWHYTYE